MSVIGPRPGLWNQDLLTAERDKYGANDVKPGLTGLIPDLQAVDAVTFYDSLVFKLAHGDQQYDLSDVSEGTLKGLILNMLINMPMETKKSMLAIDEPENNLHPAWQKVIGNWIQMSENYEQCFISTHSPDFLDVFTEEFKHENVRLSVFRLCACLRRYGPDIYCGIKKFSFPRLCQECFCSFFLELSSAQPYLRGSRKITGSISWNFFGRGERFFVVIRSC